MDGNGVIRSRERRRDKIVPLHNFNSSFNKEQPMAKSSANKALARKRSVKKRPVQKSPDLFDLTDISNHFGISESTVRRKVKISREQGFGFILPLFSSGSKLLWRKEDVLAWKGENPETIEFNSLPISPPPQVIQTKTDNQVRKGLARFGIELPPQT